MTTNLSDEQIQSIRLQNPGKNIKEVLARLNPKQLESAMATNGVIRIIAGPGTGKTQTMTARTARLIREENIDPRSCLSITFTNKAAEQLKERIVELAGYDGHFVNCGTFHSLARRYILDPNSNHDYFKSMGYSKGFIIIDTDDAKQLAKEAKNKLPKYAKEALEALEFDERQLLSKISLLRADGISVDEYSKNIANDNLSQAWATFRSEFDTTIEYAEQYEKDAHLARIKEHLLGTPSLINLLVGFFWQEYSNSCIDVSGIDFDDMLVHASKLLEHDRSIATRLANQFTHISVDEFQDTNPVQYKLIKSIINQQKEHNLFVIGDPRQSIYRFRKAEVEIIMNLDKDYPACRTIEMTTNYRSTQSIIGSANRFAISMPNQITDGQLDPGIIDDANGGNIPWVVEFDTDDEEASWIANTINKIKSNGEKKLSDLAILYRTNSLKTKIEKALANNNIDYKVVGDVSFYDRKEVKDIVNTLRVLVRKKDTIAYGRMVDSSDIRLTGVRLKTNTKDHNTPNDYVKFLGSKNTPASKQFKNYAESIDKLYNIESSLLTYDNFVLALDMGNTVSSSIKEIRGLFSSEEEMNNFLQAKYEEGSTEAFEGYRNNLLEFWEAYLMPPLLKYIKSQKKDIPPEVELIERKENVLTVIDRLLNLAKHHGSFKEAIDELVLLAENSHQIAVDCVQLMTIHASKGLEFPVVIVAGCEEETFFKEEKDPENIAEEGRIFYVAKTRAEKGIFYTVTRNRFVNGEDKKLSRLKFLDSDLGYLKHFDVSNRKVIKTSEEVDDASAPQEIKSSPTRLRNRTIN